MTNDATAGTVYLTTTDVMYRLALPNRRAARRWMDRAAAHTGVSVLRGEGRAESRICAAALDAYLTALETGPHTTLGVSTGTPTSGSVSRPPQTAVGGHQRWPPVSAPQAPFVPSRRRRVTDLPSDFGGLTA